MMAASNENCEPNGERKGPQAKTYDPQDFRIEPVKEEDYELYVAFLVQYLSPHAQLSRGLGVPADEGIKHYREQVKLWIASGASVCATYIPTNELAGIMLTQILTRNETQVNGVENTEECLESVQNLDRILLHLERAVNFFEDPEVDKILKIALTTVQPKFSGNKLTYRLTEVSERLAVALGCQMVTSQSTSVITQHIRTKMGYEVCYTLDYADFELDGKKILDVSAMNGSTVAKVFKKYLKKK